MQLLTVHTFAPGIPVLFLLSNINEFLFYFGLFLTVQKKMNVLFFPRTFYFWFIVLILFRFFFVMFVF